ncbi:universal stress protein [Streptomyces liangshanensis]|uniref:Universal stress protein n=1 Tax=Streptomyces liangshanensis TaxID=2717324 RepID=A0A6G9GZR6_9ACTN|nr:universal stress protein [Streptomyces liangshanensis]QIQ03714.1 universal stress protein [Streptomyces liangshanensis]
MSTTSGIVVGVDGSEPSLKALHWAVRQAELTGDRVTALIGWEYPATGWAAMMPGTPAEFDPEALARQILDETLDKNLDAAVAGAVERRVVNGPAAQVLIDASEGAALLVVGERGYSGFTATLLGSVSLHVTQHAKSPVVVVRGEQG